MNRVLARCALALLVVASPLASAQDGGRSAQAAEPEAEVLISPTARHGGWGGPVVHLSTLRDRAAVFVGARGGWLLDGRFTIGGGGFGLANDVSAPAAARGPGEDLVLDMGYGGGWVEYTFSPLQMVHVSVGALVGGGGLSLRFRDGGSHGSDGDVFFVTEPAVSAEVNLATHVRLDVGVAYRWIVDADMAGLSRSDVAGFSALAAVKFGKF